ncbi:iron-sulfur cluster co-chaperone protein HscB homolog [Diospyros lotus]|uniref:iron-sulfur cluster co-chaperone protein HscB homolog n=1 Tax=Diospyros lotus TaxID=55363 RepID=UPI0022531518|nr:iron-sulfur cluster co-chaperone protein HscB homolog [Diospyros lotus]
MLKQKLLWLPFAALLRRSVPGAAHLSADYAPKTWLSSDFSSPHPSASDEEADWASLSPIPHFGELGFLGRSFCSGSSKRVIERCWNCNSAVGTTVPFLVCDACRSVQPVNPSVDYFQIFGLENKFEIEDKNLEERYKDWQKKVHPDLVHSKSKKEKEYAAEQSARVIDAYRTLSNPLSRVLYILKLEGVEVDEEKTISEPELLAEIMEIRESVEEAADTQALVHIQSQMQENMKHWYKSFANAFQNQKYDEARMCIQRMTYYQRVNEEIIKKL